MVMMRNMHSNVVRDISDEERAAAELQGYVEISTNYFVPDIVTQAPIEHINDALAAAAAVHGDNPVLPHIQLLVDEHAENEYRRFQREAAETEAELKAIHEATKPKKPRAKKKAD